MQKVIKIGTTVLAIFGAFVLITAIVRGTKSDAGVAQSIKSTVSFNP